MAYTESYGVTYKLYWKDRKSQWKPLKWKQKKRVRNQNTNSYHDRNTFTEISLKVPIQALKYLKFFVVTFRFQGNYRKWRNNCIRQAKSNVLCHDRNRKCYLELLKAWLRLLSTKNFGKVISWVRESRIFQYVCKFYAKGIHNQEATIKCNVESIIWPLMKSFTPVTWTKIKRSYHMHKNTQWPPFVPR